MDRPPPGVKTGKPESYLRFLLMGNRSFETAPKITINIHLVTMTVAGAKTIPRAHLGHPCYTVTAREACT